MGTWSVSCDYVKQIGGARRDRTADLLHAMQALSQLSYGPTRRKAGKFSGALRIAQADRRARSIRFVQSSRAPPRRSALATTETELRLIASAAIIGLNSRPVNGYSTPAAIGTPNAL